MLAASRLRRAAAGVASSVPGFLLRPPRAASRLAPLAVLLAALAFAQPATAQTIVELIANDGQTSADADAAAYGKIYATSFTTGSHSTGYRLTRVAVWLKKDGMESRTGSDVSVVIYTDSAGTPGVDIGYARISDEPTTSWAGYGFDIRPNNLLTSPVGIDLAANTTYWVQVSAASNQNTEDDHYFVGGTSSDNEDSGGLSGWSLGNDRLLKANDGSWDASTSNTNALRLELRGSTRAAANLPSAPTGLTVSAGTNSGELDASWTAPSRTILDYDLRYYEGSTDPTDDADWVEEHETDGLETADSTIVAATIKGLKASTAYRVQVRAASVDGEGAWSASVAGTTSAAPGTNRAPRAVTTKSGDPDTACKLWTDTSQPADTITANAGALTSTLLKTRGTETTDWPATCAIGSGNTTVPVFDDLDGGDLYYTFSYTLPANVRGLGGKAPFFWDASNRDRLWAKAVAIGSNTNVRVDLTATDEHGASATAWVRFTVGRMLDAVGAPSFSATVADQTADTGTAFSLVLPGATGGDVIRFGSAVNSPYTYAVSGLPAGLSFDAATRRVSGTPTASGPFTVTYTADDADNLYSRKASPGPADTADAARQTFTIQVTGSAPPPPTPPLLLSARVSSDGTKLTLYYDQELDPNSAPAHAHFSANIAGTGHSLPVDATPAQREADPVIVSGSTVTVTLALTSANAVTAGQTVAMGYKAANAAANPIKNLAGLKAGRISGLAAINDVGATVPTVTGVSIISPPTHDTDTPADGTKDTYGVGAKISVSLDFSEAVTVDTSRGAPRLKIGFGGGNHKWAVSDGGSATLRSLVFTYAVVSGDTSTAGVAVVANSLELTGGSIRSAATGQPASLAHTGLPNNSGHKVNGSLDAQPPRFVSATVNGNVLKVTFDEDLDTSSVPAGGPFLLRVRHAASSINSVFGDRLQTVGVNGKVVEVPLVHEIPASAAVTVHYEKPNANFLKGTDGNAVAGFSGEPVTNNTGALSDPTNLKVVAATLGGSLTVTWKEPTTATTTAPTGYALRYYAGSEDPPAGREADWKEDVAGLPTDTAGTAETATIEGLKANTAYRVQLRAKYSGFNGPWSASESGTTGSPSTDNNPPRALKPSGNSDNVCAVETGGGAVKGEWVQRADGGTLVSQAGMVAPSKRTDDGNWPTVCVDTTPKWVPKFDDVDGDKLTLSVEPTPVPDNVRVNPKTYFWVEQPGDRSTIHSDPASAGRVFFQGQAAFRDTAQRAVRTKVTATDPHGASVTVRVVYIVDAVRNDNGAPSLPEVPVQNASPGRAFSLVLPPASGGDNFVSTLTRGSGRQYYYAISGLPEGLSFDPETRTVSGVPSQTGSFEVTYIADDPDTVGSAYLNPEETDETKNLADVASETFTINVKPFIDLVRVTSAPTHDANGDGRNDTYTKGDKIVFDVEFTEPVKVDGEGADGGNVRLRLDVGPNGGGKAQRDANREVAKLTDTFHGGKTLRFTYIVEGNSLDPDGVFVQTFGDDGKVVTLRPGASIKGLVSDLDADLTRTDFITGNAVGEDGIPMTYVNGWATAAGPTPVSATVNGKTLTVTFDEDLAALSAADLEALQLHFAVQGAGDNLGNRNAFQHPSQVGTTADAKVLGLTLGVAARAGETITLTYKRFDHKGPLKDGDGNMAPAFVDFVVKNDTGGSTVPVEGTLVGNTGQSNDDTFAFAEVTAQAFTTGSNTGGYKLTKVTVPYSGGVPAAASHTMYISGANANGGFPSTGNIGILTYGSVSGTTVTYTASGEGIDLDAGTEYFVHHNPTSNPSGITTRLTDSDNEDSGAADGWSLRDTSYILDLGWKSRDAAWQIAIDGVVIGAATTTEPGPQPQSASVAGTELKIVFDKALDDTSSESGQHFEVSANDPNDPKGERVETAGKDETVAVSGDTVTVTLAEAVPPGGAASVTYDPPTLSLKAAEGNGRVARFEGFKIETVYDKTVPVLARAAVVQTSKNPDGFRVALYYDEALDPESVPATTDFSLTLDSNAAVTPNAVALEGSAVVLTVDLAKAPGEEAVDVTYTEADVSYAKSTDPIRDLAGNEAAAFARNDVDVETAGAPAVVAETTVTVPGDEVTLVSNTGQNRFGGTTVNIDRAQAFTTGSRAGGYKLTSVEVPFTNAVPAANLHTIRIHASNSSNRPGDSLATLSYGSVSGDTVTYTGDIDLASGTTYFVVVDLATSYNDRSYQRTNSDNEDAGGANGWSLGNGSLWRSWNTGAWSTSTHSWQIALHGPGQEEQQQVPGLRAEGARLTVTYDKSLDPASVPAPERFALHHDAGLGEQVEYGRVTGVTVEGKEAMLQLGFDVYPCAGEYPFTLTYASSETDKNLRTMTGEFAPGIEAAAVANTRWPECYAAEVSGNSGGGTGQGNQGKSLSLKFDRPLDTGKALKASLFGLAGQSGGTAPAVAGAAYSADGTGVVLTLERALGSGETVTVGYTRPRGEPGLWDAKGRQLADFSGVAVTAPEVAVVTGVEVVSDSGEDGTYALGETVRVRVTFSEAVEVDTAGGTPRLNIDLDPAYWGTKPAAYESGSGTAELLFAYTVVQPNESTRGIAVLADTLEANGCTIRAAADGKDVRLAHAGLGHDPAHKVDWRLAPAGTVSVTAVAVVSDAGEDDTYGLGDRIRVQVTFSEAVSVTGAPRLKIDMDPAHWGAKWATYEGGDGTTELTFAYEVAQPNESTGGIAVLANTLELNGGTIRSASGDVDAHLPHAGLGHDPAHKIDWQLTPPPDTTAPVLVAVSAVGVSSSPASGDTYALGETIRVSVVFDGAVEVSGSPRLAIDMDPAAWGEHQAVYESGSGTGSLTFAHTVVQPNESTQGVAVLANTLEANGGTIRSASGTDADLSHAGLGHDAAHKVDWRSGLASVTAVTVSSTPASGDTYLHGETIRVTVAFDKAVTVTGAPHLKIDMDPAHWGEKLAAYEGGSGTGSLTFAHTVVEPNLSTQGIALLANTLEAGGGILTAGTSLNADLAHTGLGHDPAHKVDWRPTLSVADAEAHEGEDAAMEFAVTLSRPASGTVTVDYATADGTATAGEDYTATTGTLTFSSGEQTKTISVPLIDDAIDEGQETFTLTLSNPSQARILDGEATGTIINSDHMPKAWTSRFGRTVAVHVVDAVEARLEGASESYLQLGGQRLGGGSPPDVEDSAQRLAPERDLWEEPDAADMPGQDMTPSQLLLGTAFHLVSEPGEGSDGPRLSAWGRVASSGFDGREEKLSLSGTVTTATLGVDGVWERWLSGLLLAYSEGDGSFTHLDLPGGDVSSSLTSLHPYVAYTLSDRVRLWGTVGYGSGALRLLLEDQRTMDTDLTMTMGALGVRGSLLKPAGAGGLHLDLRSDVLWMVMDSAKADNLAATEAEASRLRLVLQGSRPVALAGGGSFTPSVEIGLRHDGGDAETGTGVEVGGSLRYASAWGLSIEASLRALVAHEEQDYREWGASGALRFDPGRQGRGLTAAIVPTWGTAASGISRLWDQSTAAGLAPDSPLAQAAAEGRLEAELGYGLLTLRGRALLTPYARVALVESADQAWHLGTRLALAESLNLSVEASRRQREGNVPAHELALRAVLGW